MAKRSELAPIERSMSIVNRLRWLTTVGIDPELVSDHIEAAEHEALAIYLGAIDDVSPWTKGDQIVSLIKRLRATAKWNSWNRAKFSLELAKLYTWLEKMYKGGSRKTLESYATTAIAWPHSTRRQSDKISWAHHKALNKRSAEERNRYMELIEAEGWSVAKLAAEMTADLPVLKSAITETLAPTQQASDLFILLSAYMQAENKTVTWATPHGKIKVTSRSPLVWTVEN